MTVKASNMKENNMRTRIIVIHLAILAMAAFIGKTVSGAEKAPSIASIARPAAGYTEIIFHGGAGPFRIQQRERLDADAPWFDMTDALVVELEPGVFLGQFPNGNGDLAFYQVV